MGLGCRLASRGCGLVLPGSSSERASPQRCLSSWPVKGAQGSLRSPGRARPPHPRWGGGCRADSEPLDSLPLLLGAAPPPHFRSGPWASRSAFSPKPDVWGWGGLLQPKLEVSSGPRGGLAGTAGPRAAVRWRHSQDCSHAVTWAASLGTPGHCP